MPHPGSQIMGVSVPWPLAGRNGDSTGSWPEPGLEERAPEGSGLDLQTFLFISSCALLPGLSFLIFRTWGQLGTWCSICCAVSTRPR